MTVSGKHIIEEFVLRHAQSRSPFTKWLNEFERISIANHNELKQFFPLTDYVGNKRYVFNIGGNNFRLVAVVMFVEDMVFIRWCGTHAEYDKITDCSIL